MFLRTVAYYDITYMGPYSRQFAFVILPAINKSEIARKKCGFMLALAYLSMFSSDLRGTRLGDRGREALE